MASVSDTESKPAAQGEGTTAAGGTATPTESPGQSPGGHRPEQPTAAAGSASESAKAAARAATAEAKAKLEGAGKGEKSEEQKKRERERAQLNRNAAKLDDAKKRGADAYRVELERQLKEFGGGGGEQSATNAPQQSATQAPPAAPPDANAVQLSPGLPAERTFEIAAGRAGWPSDQDVKQWVPVAAQIVSHLEGWTKGTRFDLAEKKKYLAFGVEVEAGGSNEAIEAIAPLLAKYGPGLLTTPEGAFLLWSGMALGVPAGEWVGQKARAKWGAKK